MRFLGVTETCDLASLYLRLGEEGHEVRISIAETGARGTLAGMVSQVADWREQLGWIAEAGDNGVILFESVSEGFGALQDDLRAQGYHVVGGSAFGDRLENDRRYAQQLLAEIGFPAAGVWEFSDLAAAERFINRNPARYVLKFSGAGHSAEDTYVGRMPDGSDVRIMLRARLAERGAATFILMEHLEGVEIGVGAYFDGERFLEPACLDWEHKSFFAGDLGELTGEMGTVATFERTSDLFARTLKRLTPHLRGKRHVGYINLNMIANERGLWPLEFTCRFGYPGFAVLEPLQAIGWGDLFATLTTGRHDLLRTRPGFCVGVVLTTPPFPYSRHEVTAAVGMPVMIDPTFDAEDLRHIHFCEVGRCETGLVTSGLYGWTMVVTGVAPTIEIAKADAYRRLARILVPNGRYRLDIGDRLLAGELARVEGLGLFDRV